MKSLHRLFRAVCRVSRVPAFAAPLMTVVLAANPSAAEPRRNLHGVAVQHLEDVFAAQSVQALLMPADPLPESLDLMVDLDGMPTHLTLTRHSLRAVDFKLVEDRGDGRLVEVVPPPVRTYRGVAEGFRNSRVALSLRDGGVAGRIRVGENVWYIQPASDYLASAARGTHVVYKTQDVRAWHGRCGNDDAPAIEPAHRATGEPAHSRPLPAPADPPGQGEEGGIADGNSGLIGYYKTKIAFDADWEFYDHQGQSSSNVTNWIDDHMNDVGAIYSDQVEICYTITQIIVRTNSSDPYSATDASGRLTQFKNDWNANHASVDREVAHLCTAQNLDGTTVGLAYNPGIQCSNAGAYSLSQDIGVGDIYTMSRQVELMAHEIGHNWSASHENCGIMHPTLTSWPAVGLTDFCTTSEQSIISHRNTMSSCILQECGCGNLLFANTSFMLNAFLPDPHCGTTISIANGTYTVSVPTITGQSKTLRAFSGTVVLQR